jgi:hypothetical protein
LLFCGDLEGERFAFIDDLKKSCIEVLLGGGPDFLLVRMYVDGGLDLDDEEGSTGTVAIEGVGDNGELFSSRGLEETPIWFASFPPRVIAAAQESTTSGKATGVVL